MSNDFALPTDVDYEEPTGGRGDGLPRINWMNGEPRDKTPGRFWITTQRADDASLALGNGWVASDHAFRSGDREMVWFAPLLRIAPIVWRQQTYIGNDEGGVEAWVMERKFGKLSDGERVAFEMLCLVHGIDVPVVMSTKGTKASMAWVANILPEYKKMRDAVRSSRNGGIVPPWWFWLTVRSAVDPKGAIVYEKTKGSMVTPPTWVLDTDPTDRATWKALYVGNDIAALGQTVYSTVGKAWATKKISDGYSDTAEPVGHNTPQAYQEDDNGIPF